MKVLRLAAVLALICQAVSAQQFRLGAPVSDFTVQDMKHHPFNYKTLKAMQPS